MNQISGFDANALRHPRRKTYGVKVGRIMVGGGAPIVVQSMTNTDTADVRTTRSRRWSWPKLAANWCAGR